MIEEKWTFSVMKIYSQGSNLYTHLSDLQERNVMWDITVTGCLDVICRFLVVMMMVMFLLVLYYNFSFQQGWWWQRQVCGLQKCFG